MYLQSYLNSFRERMDFDDWIDHFIFLSLPYPGYDASEDDYGDNEDLAPEEDQLIECFWQQSSPADSDTFEEL